MSSREVAFVTPGQNCETLRKIRRKPAFRDFSSTKIHSALKKCNKMQVQNALSRKDFINGLDHLVRHQYTIQLPFVLGFELGL